MVTVSIGRCPPPLGPQSHAPPSAAPPAWREWLPSVCDAVTDTGYRHRYCEVGRWVCAPALAALSPKNAPH
eukprot:2853738-Pyramimonas_sp.AAC.1